MAGHRRPAGQPAGDPPGPPVQAQRRKGRRQPRKAPGPAPSLGWSPPKRASAVVAAAPWQGKRRAPSPKPPWPSPTSRKKMSCSSSPAAGSLPPPRPLPGRVGKLRRGAAGGAWTSSGRRGSRAPRRCARDKAAAAPTPSPTPRSRRGGPPPGSRRGRRCRRCVKTWRRGSTHKGS